MSARVRFGSPKRKTNGNYFEIEPSLQLCDSSYKGFFSEKNLVCGFSAKDIFTILGVFLVFTLINWAWIYVNQIPPFEHSGRSIQDSVILWARFCQGRGFAADDYPPLASIASCFYYTFFGVSQDGALLSQFPFVLLGFVSVFWLGKRMFGYWGGLLSLLACFGTPWLSYHVRGYFLEVSLASMVVTAFALLFASNFCGKKPKVCILLGFVMGLGMLSKWAFAFYVAPAFLYVFYLAFKEGKHSFYLALSVFLPLLGSLGILRYCVNAEYWSFPVKYYMFAADLWLLLLLGVYLVVKRWQWSFGAGIATSWSFAFFTCGWWYFLSAQELQNKALGDLGQRISQAQSYSICFGTLNSAFWLFALFCLCGVIFGIIYKKSRVYTWLSLLSLTSALTVYLNTDMPPIPRYMLPGIMLFSVVGFSWLGIIKNLNKIAAVLLIFVGFMQIASSQIYRNTPYMSGMCPLEPEFKWSLKVPVLSPPSLNAIPLGPTVDRLALELSKSGEYRITGALLPQGRMDVDMLMLESLFKGHIIDVEHYLPGRSTLEPRTSLLLVIGEDAEKFPLALPMLSEYKFLETWSAPGWGAWSLYKHPTRIDHRPKPDATDGPPTPYTKKLD